MGVLEKVKKLKSSRAQQGGGGRMQGIFHQWKDSDNIIRLVGEFLEVKTHFIAPAPKRKDRGLCRPDAFQGDDKLSPVINCLDWDVEKEETKSTKTCPICKINAVAHAIVKESPDNTPEEKEEKKAFEKIRSDANPSARLKWNILDRDDPHVLEVTDGNEKKVLGFKIATVGMEAWDDIEGIFEQMGFDITSAEDGIDIKVTKGHNGTRVTYSAQAVIDASQKPPVAKVTPFTDEEKALRLHDLKVICSKQVDAQRIVDALHEDLRDMLDVDMSDGTSDATDTSAKDGQKAPAEKAPAAEEQASSDKEGAAIEDAISEEDGDGLLDGTAEKKA